MQSIRALGLTNPIAILPNGVDLPDRLLSKPIPKWAEGFPSEKKILLFLGRLHPKKGLVHLIRGWAMARRGNSDASATWLLVIAGWDQRGHQAEIESLVDGLGVNDSVFFVGPQFNEDKITSFNRADAFVLPSFSEGLPMAVLEAWAYRLPVIMTPQCNLPEGFSSGAAIPVDADADSIYEGLSNLFIMDSSALASMGERGRKLVETNFAWPRIAANMYSVYQWLLDKNEKPQCVKLVTNL
jgi:poly(glycerol-phosphate) alpha-glucosyltransferase